jgi:hypothetical protein
LYHNLALLEVRAEGEETAEYQANNTRQHNQIAELAWKN